MIENEVRNHLPKIEDLRKKKIDEKDLAYHSTKQVDAKIANLIWGIDDSKKEL